MAFKETSHKMQQLEFQRSAIDPGGCVSEAWELVKRNFGLYLGAGLFFVVLTSCIPFLNFFLLGPAMGGFAYLVLRDLRNEPIDFGMFFKGFEKFVPLMVLGLIQAIPGIIFQILQYTGNILELVGGPKIGEGGNGAIGTGLMSGIVLLVLAYFVFQMIWNAALIFAIPLVVERNASIGDAITVSLSAVFSNLGGLVVLAILNMLVGLLGFLALCVGIFVALPVTLAAYVIAYRQVFPQLDLPDFNTAPPPPDAYNFGGGV